jgi:Zn ribbon nucleic-acid-binding protein
MSNPKIKPCPKCRTTDHIGVYKYDSGWQHVECDKCHYFGPGEGSARAAIISHNAKTLPPPPQGKAGAR